MSEDGSVEGNTPLAVAMAERTPLERGDPRLRGRARGPLEGPPPEPESPVTGRSEQSEMSRLFKGPPS